MSETTAAGQSIRNWNGKPYHSLDYMLKQTFGEKVYKVTLNGGMSCPNRDGKLGSRGCIFCYSYSSARPPGFSSAALRAARITSRARAASGASAAGVPSSG